MSQEKWDSQTRDVDWNRHKGNDGLNLEWPLSPAFLDREGGMERDMEKGSRLRDMERNASTRSGGSGMSGGMRETMTVFPAGREKLGGVQIPQKF